MLRPTAASGQRCDGPQTPYDTPQRPYEEDGLTVRPPEHERRLIDNRNGVSPAVDGEASHKPWSVDVASSVGPSAGRVALVSGGNRGLGLQLVRALVDVGMQVVMASRSVENGYAAIELLGDQANQVAVLQLDITNPASVGRVASWLRLRLGRCDVLVNNAAILIDDDDDALAIDLDVVWRTLETNLLGSWRLSQAIAPMMRDHRYGRIVNVSSRLASLNSMQRGLAAYRVSKCGINALTRMLADELAGDRILVNACCPGPVHVEDAASGSLPRLSASPDTPVWLATLPDGGPTGGFFCERQRVSW